MHTSSAVSGKMSSEERFQSFSWLWTALLVVLCINSEASKSISHFIPHCFPASSKQILRSQSSGLASRSRIRNRRVKLFSCHCKENAQLHKFLYLQISKLGQYLDLEQGRVRKSKSKILCSNLKSDLNKMKADHKDVMSPVTSLFFRI